MTDHINHPNHAPDDSTQATRRGDEHTLSTASLIARGVLDVVDGQPPVPIDVWRVADDEPSSSTGDHRCTIRMAQLLIGMFTAPGDIVVSVGFDPALAGAAGAAGLPYQPVEHVTQLATLQHLAGGVGLLLVPWPPNDPNGRGGQNEPLADWLARCRTLMAHRGVTVIALAPAPPTDVYVACARLLLPAARTAGLGWLQHIVAITAPFTVDGLDSAAVPVSPDRAGVATSRPAQDTAASAGTPVSLAVHADLIALVVKGDRRG